MQRFDRKDRSMLGLGPSPKPVYLPRALVNRILWQRRITVTVYLAALLSVPFFVYGATAHWENRHIAAWSGRIFGCLLAFAFCGKFLALAYTYRLIHLMKQHGYSKDGWVEALLGDLDVNFVLAGITTPVKVAWMAVEILQDLAPSKSVDTSTPN